MNREEQMRCLAYLAGGVLFGAVAGFVAGLTLGILGMQ